jgi:flagellar assembly protein FliH
MLSSFRARLLKQTAAAKGFVYRPPDAPSTDNGGAISADLPAGAELLWNEKPEEPVQEPQVEPVKVVTEEEIQAREQQAWQKGFAAASAQAQEQIEKAVSAERIALAAALTEFAQGREAYYQRIEVEIVHLVLSMARKVLHREAQVDPMLLTGMVRVALEKIAHGTAVTLRVPPSQVESWRVSIRSMPRKDLAVEVVADEGLTVPSCVIVTEMGSTEVSLEAHLEEIERGFLDLLAGRPDIGSCRAVPQVR